MKYIKLGKSVLTVSRICMGCMGFGNATAGLIQKLVDENATQKLDRHDYRKKYDAILTEGKFEAEILAGQGRELDDGIWAARVLVETMADHYLPGADPLSWLAYDPDLLHDNLTDPLNMGAHIPTKQILWNLVDAYRFANSAECVDKIPASLPVYIFGGDCDPTCGYGEGAYAVANHFLDRGNKM